MSHWKNWSGNVDCEPAAFLTPPDVSSLQGALAGASNVRVAGSGHSFSRLVPTGATLISLEKMSGVIGVDKSTRRAQVAGGTTIHDLGPALAKDGLALANQGDIDCQALAGALATATHGTGQGLGCIASTVTGLEIALPDGTLRRFGDSADLDALRGAVVSLGALGVVTEIELQCDARYNLRERVWVEETDELLAGWPALCDQHRHFEFFAFPFLGLVLAKTLSREPYDPDRGETVRAADSSGGGFARLLELNRSDPGAAREAFARALLRTTPTEDLGPAHEIFPSERSDLFNEMEYAVPVESGAACLQAVLAAIEQADLPVLFPIEFRTVKADDLWLSPFYQRDSAVIAVHQDAALDHRPVFEVAEPILREYGGRPHWGKIHSLGATELQALYSRWPDFLELRRQCDPENKMLNPYLRGLFGVSG